MRRALVFLLLLLVVTITHAQVKAVTETGDDVFLFDDGTWRYADEPSDVIASEIPTNATPFLKNPKSTFLLKSNVLKAGIWVDSKKWSFKKSTNNEDAEYEFQSKKGSLHAMFISEKFEIPLPTLKTIALDNGRKAAPDLQIIKEEYRSVNGLKVLLLQMEGTLQGIKFVYYGYYYSGPGGTVQFVTFTAPNLLAEYLPECEELLNGLSAIE
jgi:hypothetical protein